MVSAVQRWAVECRNSRKKKNDSLLRGAGDISLYGRIIRTVSFTVSNSPTFSFKGGFCFNQIIFAWLSLKFAKILRQNGVEICWLKNKLRKTIMKPLPVWAAALWAADDVRGYAGGTGDEDQCFSALFWPCWKRKGLYSLGNAELSGELLWL